MSSDQQSVNLLCRICNTWLDQTGARSLGKRDGHDRVVDYRCPECGHGGERYVGGADDNCQFGPVFRPESYATQLRIHKQGRSVTWPETGVEVKQESTDGWEVVADD
jgi:hypothetical protein